jgi:hypothetical protein
MPVKAWFLSLPYVANPDIGPTVSLNPYQWAGHNGWGDTNAQTIVACAETEEEARQMAADIDCGIWLESAYAACIPFATCQEDWKPGVLCVEWGESENE